MWQNFCSLKISPFQALFIRCSLGKKKLLIHNILKAVALAYSGCNERTNEDLCWLLIVVRNEKLHKLVKCVGIDSLESHQTQRFYC